MLHMWRQVFWVQTVGLDVSHHCGKSGGTAEKVKMRRLQAALLSDIDSVCWSYFLILKDNVHSLHKQTACKSYQGTGDLNKCCVHYGALLWPYRSCVEIFMWACVPPHSPDMSLPFIFLPHAVNWLQRGQYFIKFLLPWERLSSKMIGWHLSSS